ncbi:MAG: YncE family protein [Pseudothermotoga sp.]
MKKLVPNLLVLLLICCSAYGYETQSVYVGPGYSRISFRDGIICLTRSKPASVLVLTSEGKFVSEISVGLSYPVNAVHHAGMIFISDYYKASVMVYTIFGRLINKVDVGPYPTTLKFSNNRVYVACSGDKSVYRINCLTLEKEEKYVFQSASLYFEVINDELLYLYYFDTDRTYERVGGSKKIVKVSNLKNPVKYAEKDGFSYILGYADGIVVCLKNDNELWRVNLSDYAKDMVLANNYIATTSLLDPVMTLVSYDGKVLKRISLPNVAHRVLYMDEKVVLLNHLPGEIYLVDTKTDEVQTIKVGSYAIDLVQISQSELAVLCTDSEELFLINLRGRSP